MSEPAPGREASPFSTRTALLLAGIGFFAFCAVMALVAFSSDLRPKNGAGSHPYSTAATGYGGLVKLLEVTGRTVRVSRIERAITDRDMSLIILTPPGYGWGDIEAHEIQEPALVVLPKWFGMADPVKPSWQRHTERAGTFIAEGALEAFDAEASITTRRQTPDLDTPFGAFSLKVDGALHLIDGVELETVIDGGNGALLAKMPYQDIYILSDPDLVNTFGLAELENAKFAAALTDWLMAYGEETIIFDATQHGFVRSENILKTALSPPFIGAALTALAAALLLGWSASLRFGAPEREDRAIALGKQALADNSAGLITMARREARLAPGYLALTRRATAKDVGAPKTLGDADLAGLFDRMSKSRKNAPTWSDVATPLKTNANSRDDLVNKARALWTWRKETTHGRE